MKPKYTLQRECRVCVHKDRERIERLLIDGATYLSLFKQFGVSEGSLVNHKRKHLTKEAAEQRDAAVDRRNRMTIEERLQQRAGTIKHASMPTPLPRKVSPEALAERDVRLATPPRSLTAWLCGDPLPGCSALDRKMQAGD